MSEPDLLYRVEDQVAWFTINRERQRNAISAAALELFLQHLDEAEQDDSVRVICVTGAGERAFCTGADLGNAFEHAGGGEAGDGDPVAHYVALLKRLARCPKPTVARVNGYCLAGGTGLMLACDIVIARSDSQFGTPEVNVGLFPMMISTLILRDVPRKKAMEMMLLGERLSAAEALAMGLVTRLAAPDDFDAEVNGVLRSLAEKSPVGLRLGKQALEATAGMPFDQAVEHLAEQLGAVVATEDAAEGIRAFMEKRKPVFKGR